jgi:hypothetical protein
MKNARDIYYDLTKVNHSILTDENNTRYIHQKSDTSEIIVNRMNFTNNIRLLYNIPPYILGLCWIDYFYYDDENNTKHVVGEVSFNEDIIYKYFLDIKNLCINIFNSLTNSIKYGINK